MLFRKSEVLETPRRHSGQANQQWRFNSGGTITGIQSGLCLDVTGAATGNGTGVELWTCNGQSNQKRTLSSAAVVSERLPSFT